MKNNNLIRFAAFCAVSIACAAAECAPLIQAHRGSRGEYDDNALGGFARCLERGIRGFETDVRFSKDHQLVIMHDNRVDRTTDGRGVVEEMTFAEIRKCRIRNCSEPVPTPGDIFQLLKGRADTFIEIEMKAYPSAFYTPEVLEKYCIALNRLAKEMLVPGTFAFTCFNQTTLRTMRKVDPAAKLGYIMGGALTDPDLEFAKSIGCCSVAPSLRNTTKEMVDKAHALGMTVCLWMVQNAADYGEAAAKGADRVTSDYPMLLQDRVNGRRKKLVCLDLDATLCQHRSPVPKKNMRALSALRDASFKCIMVGAGNAQRIYGQMENYPIDIVANYGMQESTVSNGQFMVVCAVTNAVDRQFFREKTDYLRRKYGYTAYDGEPLEFHASGMVTFALLGTKAPSEKKLAFDPDRRRRRAMYREVCDIFKGYSVYIGGSTSFDFAGPQYNKYDATLDWARRHGYKPEDVVFVGDDFADGGGDSHVRIKGMDRIVITDYRKFPQAVSVLLK
ncbi:MAG: hypothetical protein IJ146_11755 [Kiritimatiellae bacterium]|nr:hypothetical protein [Kiritimatiellia bacterium]